MNTEYAETVIIGAGPQGIGVAGALQELGYKAVVLEQGVIGNAWVTARWDGLVVNTGNRSIRLPGWEYDGDDPDGFMSANEVVERLRRYAKNRELDVREHMSVQSIDLLGNSPEDASRRYCVTLSDGGRLESRNLVVAVGGYARPRIPAFAAALPPSIRQLHSSEYRSPEALPEGAVLVVGSGSSGHQIADELRDEGREVYLSVGRHAPWPRRYRGRDILEWMRLVFQAGANNAPPGGPGGEAPPADKVPGLPVISGRNGGQHLNIGTLAAKGVTLIGSILSADEKTLTLRDNVVAIAEQADKSIASTVEAIDAMLIARGFTAPKEPLRPGIDLSKISPFAERLDLVAAGISTIIFATGFAPEYGLLPAELRDESGTPIQRNGLGSVPGLYYASLPNRAALSFGSSVDIGRFIAQQIHIDNLLRHGLPGSLIV